MFSKLFFRKTTVLLLLFINTVITLIMNHLVCNFSKKFEEFSSPSVRSEEEKKRLKRTRVHVKADVCRHGRFFWKWLIFKSLGCSEVLSSPGNDGWLESVWLGKCWCSALYYRPLSALLNPAIFPPLCLFLHPLNYCSTLNPFCPP